MEKIKEKPAYVKDDSYINTQECGLSKGFFILFITILMEFFWFYYEQYTNDNTK